jgi:diguanylate cyclase (GGDEF)-like protein/PAS domain S-box-containing protein
MSPGPAAPARAGAEEALLRAEARWRALLAASREAVVVLGPGATIRACNARAERFFGRPAAELVGLCPADSWAQLVREDGSPFPLEEFPALVAERTGAGRHGVVMGLVRPGRPTGWISVNAEPVVAVPGEPPREVVVTFTDLTARRQAEERLRRAEGELRLLAESASDLVSRHDPAGVYLFASPGCLPLLGHEPGELLGRSLYDFLHPDDVAGVAEHHARWLEQPGEFVVQFRMRHAAGHWVWLESIGRTVPDAATGYVSEIHVTSRDVTSRKRHEEELARRALRDPLTGLANRSALLERLAAALARSERLPTTVAVLFFDLDRFKPVNDRLGHAAGDALLVAVARRLGATVRDTDLVSRFGGDEFVVLCADVRGPEEALAVARRLAEAVQQPLVVAGEPLTPSASVGVAVAGGHADAPESLLGRADAAMYAAKRQPADLRVQLAEPA